VEENAATLNGRVHGKISIAKAIAVLSSTYNQGQETVKIKEALRGTILSVAALSLEMTLLQRVFPEGIFAQSLLIFLFAFIVMAATLPVPENPPWCDGPGLSPEALVVMA
jgi:hypothetical protein